MNLKELTTLSDFLAQSNFTKKQPWIRFWRATGFVPPKLNIIVLEDTDFLLTELEKSLSTSVASPACRSSQIRLYTGRKMPMDLIPILPIFQVEFGQTAILPSVSAEFLGPNSLLLADATHHNKVLYKALLQPLILHKLQLWRIVLFLLLNL